jgi:hypothetical protein
VVNVSEVRKEGDVEVRLTKKRAGGQFIDGVREGV